MAKNRPSELLRLRAAISDDIMRTLEDSLNVPTESPEECANLDRLLQEIHERQAKAEVEEEVAREEAMRQRRKENAFRVS